MNPPKKILFVFNWLVVGGEETEVRLLVQHLDPTKFKIDVIACFRKPNMPEQTHTQLRALGVDVDTTPYTLSFEDTVDYLVQKIPNYGLIVACQAVPDVYPALEKIENPPPLIEHGGLVEEATRGPKHLTARYIGVCDSIRAAAASVMPDRPHHALEIPSMVDLSEFDSDARPKVRAELQLSEDTPLIGWVGRLDRKKRVEDVIKAAAIVQKKYPNARFLFVGGADAFMPEYVEELKTLSQDLNVVDKIIWLGDRPDVPRLMSGMDIFVWLSQGEGMPHVIAEAGASGLPVIATKDNGTAQQIMDHVSGIFVPHQNPAAVADCIEYLLQNPTVAKNLGNNLRKKVEAGYSAANVAKQWEAVFEEVMATYRSSKKTS
jgi:glycosyltransferase involved in cell wall biosynthesis